jgi:flavodoxin
MNRTLVVYYSRTGTTQIAARQIARGLHADLEEIEPLTPHSGMVGYVRSSFEATFGKLTSVEPRIYDPADYELVIVGSPVWNAALSSPVRTYLVETHARMRRVAFFCTCGHYGSEPLMQEMTRLCGKVPAAKLVLREGDVARGRARRSVERFTGILRDVITTPEPRPRLVRVPRVATP